MRRFAVLLLCPLLAVLACSGEEEVDATALCEDVFQAIAQRVQTCTNDTDLANQRYTEAQAALRCAHGGTPYNGDPRFGCSRSIAKLDCKQVQALGNDYAGWVADPSCAPIFDAGAADAGADQ